MVLPDFSSLSEDDWDEIRFESLRTGEPEQFIALRRLRSQRRIGDF